MSPTAIGTNNPEFIIRELIKIAKDCGSGATFTIFIVSVILNLIIFIPKIIILFK